MTCLFSSSLALVEVVSYPLTIFVHSRNGRPFSFDVGERNLVVHGSVSIKLLNHDLPFLTNGLGNPLLVVGEGSHTDYRLEVRVFLENYFMKEVLLECIGNAFIQRNISPLTHLAVHHIMVAYSLHSSLCPHHLVRLIRYSTKRFRKPNPNETLNNKIHFINFLELFVNNFVLLGRHESPRQHSLGKQVEQLFVRCLAPRVVS